MQPVLHAADASLHHLHAQQIYADHWDGDFYCRLEVRTNATAIVTREKNSFPFVLGTVAELPESSLRSYLRLPRPDDRRSIPVTGSEGGGTVSAVDYE